MTSYATTKEVAGALDASASECVEYLEKHTQLLSPNSEGDCDLSDGREKTDTTPENLKKIDDVIELSDDTLRPQFWSVQPTRAIGGGIPQAVICTDRDESDIKHDMDEKSATEQQKTIDTNRKRDLTESETNISSPMAVIDESSIDSSSTIATRQSFAFTIDNFNDKATDPAATQAKYRNMLERFQQRHRRGSSLSKLENSSDKGSMNASNEQVSDLSKCMTKSLNIDNSESIRSQTTTTATEATKEGERSSALSAKVKLRARDRSASRVKDSSKRHSWSPRSSTSELTQVPPHTNKFTNEHNQPQTQTKSRYNAPIPPQSSRKSNAVTKNKPPNSLQITKDNSDPRSERQRFTPRSTVMQLALQKVDFLCAQPPLADFKHLKGEADNVSEAGTYTLDGDNYTEEQKDLMNIDKSNLERAHKARRAAQVILSRPTGLEIGSKIQSMTSDSTRQNVLEVNYYHEPEMSQKQNRLGSGNDFILSSHQSATSYLEKIKSRVLRNISVTKGNVQDHNVPTKKMTNKAKDSVEEEADDGEYVPSADVGTFTSVTTSGVLAKQCTLNARPKLSRNCSLSTSQIDSSEYVHNETKLKQTGAAAFSGGFTDHQKAEYRLNVFTNQKDSTAFAGPSRSFIQTPPDSPNTALKIDQAKLSDGAVLKTAQNKNDWIQEWARNARARSLASCEGSSKTRKQLQTQELMTRSYTCSETGGECLIDDDGGYNPHQQTVNYNKLLAARCRLAGGCEFDYTSDPAISSTGIAKTNDDFQRPPKSPTKIPSPMHSLARTRSASRSRANTNNMLQLDSVEADTYLQRTAAAINNLQQNLSRNSSLQSPPQCSSPRNSQAKRAALNFYSPEERSPQHSLASPTDGGSCGPYQQALLRGAHKRNFSMESYHKENVNTPQLMTSSFNEQQMKNLTGGNEDYGGQRLRGRKNSYDGNMQFMLSNSPVTRRSQNNWSGSQTAREANRTRFVETQDPQEVNSLSPLRRSSSYSAKIATSRSARPQFQNLYTPPAARHNYVPPNHAHHRPIPAQVIKKSASSNNFSNACDDYEEDLAYYIRDEDDDGIDDDLEEYYSSGEELEDNSYYHELYVGEKDNITGSNRSKPEDSEPANVPLTNTRYNKALLMRIERSKQKVAGTIAPSSAGSTRTAIGGAGGVAACPNTPELPRRNVKSAPRSIPRQSMPRDSSLSRLTGNVPNSLASAKKQLLQTAAAAGVLSTKTTTTMRAQPKYLDISKYKPAQGNTFLRKNDAKSTLKAGTADVMKRSPSTSSMGLSRNDGTRISNRSVKSSTSITANSGSILTSRASSAARRDTSAAKQKEAEMAMWKRRSKYDPMKAAAEDRRKKEEAKKMAQMKNEFTNESVNESQAYVKQTTCENQWTDCGELQEADDYESSN